MQANNSAPDAVTLQVWALHEYVSCDIAISFEAEALPEPLCSPPGPESVGLDGAERTLCPAVVIL